MKKVKIRILRNPYGSGLAACEAWGKFLWGHPEQRGPDKFHVYGHHRRTRRVDVEFTPSRIVVVVHWNPRLSKKIVNPASEFHGADEKPAGL